jgi:hypothetical protein
MHGGEQMTDFTADGYRCKGCSEKIGAGELRVVRLQRISPGRHCHVGRK